MKVVDFSTTPLECLGCDAKIVQIGMVEDGSRVDISVTHAGEGCSWWQSDDAQTWVKRLICTALDIKAPT